MFELNEATGTYTVTGAITETDILMMANQIARKRLAKGEAFTSPTAASAYVQNLLQEYEHEVFAVLFLDNQHRVIAFEELFSGTVNSSKVYPRELVKTTLKHNAAAVMFAHNHPSGVTEPSGADKQITNLCIDVLKNIEVRVLDHFVVSTEGTVSFAERGLI